MTGAVCKMPRKPTCGVGSGKLPVPVVLNHKGRMVEPFPDNLRDSLIRPAAPERGRE